MQEDRPGHDVHGAPEETPVGLLSWLFVGLVAGVIAEMVVGRGIRGFVSDAVLRGQGLCRLVLTILLGVVGAFLGGFVSSAMGWGDVTGFNLQSLVIATLGAIALILAWHFISDRRGNRHRLI